MYETNGRKSYNLLKSNELMSHFIVPSPSTALVGYLVGKLLLLFSITIFGTCFWYMCVVFVEEILLVPQKNEN